MRTLALAGMGQRAEDDKDTSQKQTAPQNGGDYGIGISGDVAVNAILDTTLAYAHDAVVAWCAAQRRKVTGVRWEIYGDPDRQTGHFDVAVYWQLA